MPKPLVIAVDGPAASGKGTLGRKLAAHFGLPHLDTGLLYRAVGKRYLQAGTNANTAIAAAQNFHVTDLADKSLHDEAIGQAASIVSAMPEVRAALLDYQKRFAAQESGAVLDGRDIGTVICPDAAVKLYITASTEVRAKRRYEQAAPGSIHYDEVLAAITERDARDSNRLNAPLTVAADAITIDTSAMTPAEVFAHALAIVKNIIK